MLGLMVPGESSSTNTNIYNKSCIITNINGRQITIEDS